MAESTYKGRTVDDYERAYNIIDRLYNDGDSIFTSEIDSALETALIALNAIHIMRCWAASTETKEEQHD